MKRTLLFRKLLSGISAVFLMMSAVSCTKTETEEKEVIHNTQVPPKMMFLGDSIAAGYGLDGYKADDNYDCPSYANLLKNKYTAELKDECEHIMVNKAVSGYTSDDLINLLKSGDLDSDLKDSDAVVVSIGGNDLLGIMLKLFSSLGRGDEGGFNRNNLDIMAAVSEFKSMGDDVDAALDKFSINIRTISEELQQRTEGTIYIQTLYDPLEYFSKIKSVSEFSAEKLGRFNSIISENASTGYNVIDVAADFKGRAGELTNISKFDIHPNAAGHEVIAEDVDKAFRETGFTSVIIEKTEKKTNTYGNTAVICIISGTALLAVICIAAIVFRRKRRTDK